MELESQPKQSVEDGGHRVCSPEETFQKYQHLISPVTGIIDCLIPTPATATSWMPGYIAFATGSIKPLSAGKGKSPEQAKTSCLCEALERYTGTFRGDERRERASYRSLQGNALHPYSLMHFSEKQYHNRATLNRNCHPFHWIPSPFDENKEIAWSPIWSLTEGRYKWIPTAYGYLRYPVENGAEKFCVADSNGCAAGNTKEEAILQGFFELVERDAIALWWYSRAPRPSVDLSSFPDPYIARLRSYYASCGRTLWALDLTNDLAIPVFAAVSRIAKGDQEKIVFGFGSHFDPQIALLRALTEVNQSLDCESLLKQEEADREEQLRKQWLLNAGIESHLYSAPHPSLPTKKMEDYRRLDTQDLKTDILACQRIVEAKGLEMLILDQTRPEVGLPVVRVVVPGLRSMWNRYAPGRLYDIPLELGWVKERGKEEDFTPLPVFI